jgi:hypothetical protein
MPFLSRLLVDRDKRRLAREREKRKQRFKQYINRTGRKPCSWPHSQTRKYK